MFSKLIIVVSTDAYRLFLYAEKLTKSFFIDRPEEGYHPTHHWDKFCEKLNHWISFHDDGHDTIVVTTNSETIINALGHAVYAGALNHECVEIHVVYEDEVLITGYNSNGALNDKWPFGFFSGRPEDGWNFDVFKKG